MLFFRYLSVFLLLIFSYSIAKTPAGIVISNTAKIEYEDETGFKYIDYSNSVSITVKQIYGLSITPDFQSITSFPDSQINISYVLKNTGNGKDRFILQVKNEINDDGDIQNLKIYVDSNENGVLDPGEQEYNNSNPLEVDSDGYIPLLVIGKIPSSPSTGVYKISLEGTSVGDSSISDTGNITEIKVSSSFSVKVKKESDRQEVFPGENLSFTINIKNHGTQKLNGIQIQTDFDNDGNPETKTGLLLKDDIPKYLIFRNANVLLVTGEILYKGENDNYWKNNLSNINGKLKTVALLINSLSPDQQAQFNINLTVDNDAPSKTIENSAVLKTEKGDINSNTVLVKIKEKTKIVIDDTDDNDSYTGSNSYTDNDDNMIIYSMTSGKGMYVDFLNEAWNLGNSTKVINILWDKGSSRNIDKTIMKVVFLDENGNPLTDTDKDGYTDLGLVKPGKRVKFITRVYILERTFDDVVIAIKGFADSTDNADFTFDIIKNVQPATVVTNVTVLSKSGITYERLKKHKVIVYEFDNDGKRTDTPPVILWTDENGYILYDENGNLKPLYNVLRYGKKYRVTIYGTYNGKGYYLSPFIEKRYFDQVQNTGDKKCWDISGNQISCSGTRYKVQITVLNDGTKELSFPLDPAGYVYDSSTNEKIQNACVYFYRCSDDSCSSYTLVDNDLLDFHSNPDAGRQTNPQLTSNNYHAGGGEGTFEFTFKNFNSSLEGWYFVEVDFECSGADTSLKNIYKPVRLNRGKTWNPSEGKPYKGEKFYIDENYPGAILMVIPMGGPSTQKLIVEKSVYPSVASIGDFVKWKITVKNEGDTTVYDVKINDYLPRGFRYKKGTSKLDGAPISDPDVSPDGRILTWNIGNMDRKTTKTIEFYTAVITSVSEGKHKNTANAEGWNNPSHTIKISSNDGFAYIRVTKGIFTDKGYIFGKVFIDQNRNGIHDENEPVIKGAKIYLDNGRYAVTDVEGKYHFDNLNPRTYVVKIDKTSIPKGAKLLITGNRNAGDPGTVFADVYPGEMHKVNFALAPFKADMEIFKRLKKIKGKIEIERGIEDIIFEPLKEKIYVKHYLIIKNKTEKPLYEVVYKEKSSATPKRGTSYLNGAPFKDPEIDGKSFWWNIPIILPEEKIKINWISSVKKGNLRPKATLNFKLTPIGKKEEMKVHVPINFGIIKKNNYDITIYFNFGKSDLTENAKKSLEKIVSYLRKTNFKHLYIKIKAHTDAVRVINPEIKDNAKLSLKRAETVKAFLKKHLIDLKRVEIKWEN